MVSFDRFEHLRLQPLDALPRSNASASIIFPCEHVLRRACENIIRNPGSGSDIGQRTGLAHRHADKDLGRIVRRIRKLASCTTPIEIASPLSDATGCSTLPPPSCAAVNRCDDESICNTAATGDSSRNCAKPVARARPRCFHETEMRARISAVRDALGGVAGSERRGASFRTSTSASKACVTPMHTDRASTIPPRSRHAGCH